MSIMNPTLKSCSSKNLVDPCQHAGCVKWPITVSPQNVQVSFFLKREFILLEICPKPWLHADSGKKKPSKNPQGVFTYVLAQGISQIKKDSHRVDIEQIPLTFAACNPEGSVNNKCVLSMVNESSRME